MARNKQQLETVALPTAAEAYKQWEQANTNRIAKPVKTDDELATEAHARVWAGILGNDKPRT